MAIGFIIVLVAIGLAVFFTAMRGGPRGAREALYTQSRAARRLFGLSLVVLAAFGIAVPALVLGFNGAHKAGVAPGGVTLSADQQRGRELFATTCGVCHTLHAAAAVGRIGPNLDILRPPKALVLNAIALGRARGYGQMPALLFTGRDANDVASFVAAVAGQ